jgi:DNA ligase (NAD+)
MKASEYLQELSKLDYNTLMKIDGFADKTVLNVVNFCQSEDYELLKKQFQTLESNNVEVNITKTKTNLTLGSKVVCITGTFDIPRTEIAQLLEAKGYKVINTVTKKLDYLIAGERGGSKIEKANSLGIEIIDNYGSLLIE